MNRFMKFDDNQPNYSVWKASFKNIVDSLILTTQEEIDLLVKSLETDSSRQAFSLRAAKIHNPIVGLQRILNRYLSVSINWETEYTLIKMFWSLS